MYHRIKRLWGFLGLAFAFVLFSCDTIEEAQPEEKEVAVEILQMNDIHGHIMDEGKYGNLAKASYYINQIRNETKQDNTILIGNGDMLQETAISRVSYGKVVIDAMSAMGFDMMGIGNHEFDWGFDRFLAYFDGNQQNGEATFPLVNSNVYYKNELLSAKNQVTSSVLIEKENVKVGIISYIGDVYHSINANMTIDYEFKAEPEQIAKSALELGSKLKDQGADLIIANIHGGQSSSCEEYEPNLLLRDLKYKDSYLIDAVINGHTHTRQDAMLKRSFGAPLPVVQSSGKLQDFGRIDLVYDKEEKKVTEVEVSHIKTDSISKKDSLIDDIIANHYEESKGILEEVYCQNKQAFKRNRYLYEYVANLMMTSTNATAAVCNTGAFRNSVEAGDLDFAALYGLLPFDNHIILCKIRGSDLAKFQEANKDFDFVYTNRGTSIATDETYTLAIIDYVYFSTYFAGYRADYVDTNLFLRDLMMTDLRLRNKTGFNLFEDYKRVLLSPMIS